MSVDRLILNVDLALRTVFGVVRSTRAVPGTQWPEATLSAAERAHACALMRVNHTGEVCAQALYQGQVLGSHNPVISEALRHAAKEETEHLAWTAQRITQLEGRTSILNPLFYLGSLSLGFVAGTVGDQWSLGFLVETERQVEAHLGGHLQSLPEQDQRSREIVTQMQRDEIEHADMALHLGAAELPAGAKHLMRLAASVMTSLTYRV